MLCWIRILLAMLMAVGLTGAFASEVNNLRVWTDPGKTRAVLDLSGGVDYRLFTLDNPPRVVVDLDQSSLTGSLKFDPEHRGVIEGVRHGVREGRHLRVVFDLAEEAKPQSFLLDPAGAYGHRLVIDLVPEQAPDPEARFRSVAEASQRQQRDVIVAIDAGHGGEDPGAIGPSRVYEKNVVLAIARELERQIDDEPGMSAILVRTGDYYIPHRERFARAQEANADLFLSIHADALHDRRVRGSSVYVLNGRTASSEMAQQLAKNENKADLAGGVHLAENDDMLNTVLLDLYQNASREYSRDAADAIWQALGGVGKRLRSGVESAPFMVLRSPIVPSVLVETGFISNPDDEQNLNSPAHQRKIAEAITAGVRRHFNQVAPPDTWIAANRQPTGEYIVRRGDTLSEIAQRHRVTTSDLRRANNLNGDIVQVGKVLLIPTG